MKIFNTYMFSRWWNRFCFFIINKALDMIWDETGRNANLIKDLRETTAEEILCDKSFDIDI